MKDLVKAKLNVYGEGGRKTGTVSCLFNPSEYSIKKGVHYADKNELGRDQSDVQYIHGESSVLSLSLYFDTTNDLEGGQNQWDKESGQEPVTKYTKQIVKLAEIDGKLHQPPTVEFSWGNLNFKGVITSISQTYNYFSKDGIPLRAKLDLDITSTGAPGAVKQSPFESPDRTKYRTITAGMTLWQLAREEYGDPEGWMDIARANGILNPLDVRPGDILKVNPKKF